MQITLTSDSKQSLDTKKADLASILTDRKVETISEARFVGYDLLGQEKWEITLEVTKL